ncbi:MULTISPECIES: competence type IV pilus ATPase ComGA [unclassified Lactobacillus]|uniref:competence type IV pilus ATPase ComGA n=1 Tax=unclassified Lactobacillus TaxID=2620435 RepID=UPI000EFD887E|nr:MULTISPECIES: competence type IV pilus ATPase ComGA [unclassified Lactobacillus]RMC25023.1 competence protein [Lactobacillus sp. ESL0247]RMC29178.1 competence protein [Lactobacillus sp. ESL0246]RMC32781.1 competence protein [Lactobacillus sp. ESL0245]RMC49721.1 competence protein [Lactobacillus sp. ESL0228]
MRIKEVVNSLIESAIDLHASDVFFVVGVDEMIVNFRLVDELKKQATLSINEGRELINFLKFGAQMDIAEHRRPQVGAQVYVYHNQNYFLRLSSLGDFTNNESLVIRIIYQIADSNYFFEEQINQLQQLAYQRGLIITSGPTGSGKTTTMYKLAKTVGHNQMVMTIEDPVEIHEATFLQTQVNLEADITYLSLLEAALRHRPDILIIGEIRNAATARLAVDAALSGHLVFATVHAKSTLQTISRLESLHINLNELSNCLTAVCYQRLLPTIKGPSCLMDIASGEILQSQINLKKRSNFINWSKHLAKLKERGEISAQVYQQFEKG